MMQSDPKYRRNPDDLNKVMVRTADNKMAPVTEFITLSRVYGPESISRFNMFTAIPVNGTPNKGYGTGKAMQANKRSGRSGVA